MTVPDHPFIFAHRGASAHEPDNSLRAFGRAVADNADGIEVDVRRTADGVLVLSHEAALPDGTVIGDTRLADLRERAAITTLDELLMASGDLMLDLEIKNVPTEPDHDESQGVAEAVVAWLTANGIAPRALVTSFHRDAIATVRDLDPGIVTGRLLSELSSTVEVVMAVAAAGHEWILPGVASLEDDPAATIAIAHEHGLKIMTWTVDDPETIRKLADAGIDGMVTNDPGLTHETLTGWK